MAGETVQYKRTVKGSVGAGMGALFNGSGRQFFILQHKDSSKFHKAGESQKLIVDQIELGRAKDCQVRFDDESWPIVSRRHAAIEKDQTGWKIVPLSQTNSTLVNGKPINTEWYLQNGDEIQLSVGGPRLGFIVPAGKQSLVSSIKLTERLNLFREQALRPYKTGITVLCCLLVLACCAGGYFMYDANEDLKQERLTRIKMVASLTDIIDFNKVKFDEEIANLNKELSDSKKREEDLRRRDEYIQRAIAAAKKDVYAVFTLITLKKGSEEMTISSVGTGFLLNDGRFVTARHCVQPWAYDDGEIMKAYALSKVVSDMEMTVQIVARSSTDSFTLSSEDFICDSSMDVTYPFSIEDASGDMIYLSATSAFPMILPDGTMLGDHKMYGADWAYAHVGKKGSLTIDSNMSKNLKTGQEVHVLGFPGSLGIADGNNDLIEPIYNSMHVSRDGLNASNCIMVSQGVAKGNSGGPVFVYADGKLKVVAIVSRKETATQASGIYGVQLQQQQYDQLVPISNLKK